jgi:hypothetical protein
MANLVHIDDRALDDLLHSPDGLVGVYVEGLSIQMAAQAKALAPVMDRSNFSSFGKKMNERFQYGPPGFTKARTHSQFGYDKAGNMYGGVAAPYGPTLFLEQPARQLHGNRRAFLTDSLYDVAL